MQNISKNTDIILINIPTIDGVLLGDISSDIRVVEKVVEEIN